MDESELKTVKELLPNLTEAERMRLGRFIELVNFVDAIGYRTEDGNKVRTYPCYHWRMIKSISKRLQENG